MKCWTPGRTARRAPSSSHRLLRARLGDASPARPSSYSFPSSPCFWCSQEEAAGPARPVLSPATAVLNCAPSSATPQKGSLEPRQNQTTPRYTSTCKTPTKWGKCIKQICQVYPDFFFFTSLRVKPPTAALYPARETYFLLPRKHGSTYKRLRNCLVKPLPHYLPL